MNDFKREHTTMKRRFQLALAGALITAVGSTLTLWSADAQASVNRYTIQANSPKPAACKNEGTVPAGTWLQNKVCGYFVGTALAGTAFDVHETAPSDYHFGHNYGGNNICAWIPPGALSASPTGTADESCSAETRERIGHRRAFGSDFNAAAHEAEDGSAVSVDPACSGGAYYNYFNGSDYNGGSLRDAAGASAARSSTATPRRARTPPSSYGTPTWAGSSWTATASPTGAE